MAETLIKNVSDTAFMVAVYRALESERPDALFRDPLARCLAGEHGQAIAKNMSKAFFGGWHVIIRTRVIDNFIEEAIARGIDTVLNLGAGLDTRPYRMELPKTLRWIEVDYPHVIELKEDRLAGEQPRCRLERVKLDLADATARKKLIAEVGAAGKNVLVLTEGVVLYLSNTHAAELADDLRGQSSFKYWIVDYFSSEAMRYRRRAGVNRKMQNAPFLFDPKDYFEFFKERQWQPKEIRYLPIEAARYDRKLRLSLLNRALFRVRSIFMSKEQRENTKKFAAYVLFEPIEKL